MCTFAQYAAPSLRIARCPWCSADRTNIGKSIVCAFEMPASNNGPVAMPYMAEGRMM